MFIECHNGKIFWLLERLAGGRVRDVGPGGSPDSRLKTHLARELQDSRLTSQSRLKTQDSRLVPGVKRVPWHGSYPCVQLAGRSRTTSIQSVHLRGVSVCRLYHYERRPVSR